MAHYFALVLFHRPRVGVQKVQIHTDDCCISGGNLIMLEFTIIEPLKASWKVLRVNLLTCL